jgi:cyanate permease
MTLGVSGYMAASPVLWAVVTKHLSKPAAPAGIAITSSLATLAGLSPALVGALKERTGSLDLGIYMVAILLAVATVVVLLATRKGAACSSRDQPRAAVTPAETSPWQSHRPRPPQG